MQGRGDQHTRTISSFSNSEQQPARLGGGGVDKMVLVVVLTEFAASDGDDEVKVEGIRKIKEADDVTVLAADEARGGEEKDDEVL